MTIFSANAQSANIIEVSWDLSDVFPGVEPSQLTITQTAPNVLPRAQQFLPPDIDLISETLFKDLSPDTTYTYSIDCVFDDGSEYAPEPGTPATTKSQATSSQGSPGSSGPIITQVPIPPDPITNLVANWIVPQYNEFLVTFDLGVDTSSVMVTNTNLVTGKVSSSPWTSFPLLKEITVGFKSKSTNVSPGSYLITVIAADGDAHQSQVTKSITLAAPPGPGAISGLTAEWNAMYTAVEIQWSQGPGTATTSFELQRYVGQDTPNQTPTTLKVSGSPYIDTPPEISATSRYTYQLVAINAFGQTSAVSNELPAPTAPSHPKNVKAKWAVKHTKSSVSWDPVEHAETYELLLFRYDLVGNTIKLEDHAGITSASFSEHLTGTENLWYQYFVIAHNKFGSHGTSSNSLTVPAPPSSPVSTTSSPTSTHPVVAPKAGG